MGSGFTHYFDVILINHSRARTLFPVTGASSSSFSGELLVLVYIVFVRKARGSKFEVVSQTLFEGAVDIVPRKDNTIDLPDLSKKMLSILFA
jgi:hypothetical protein